MHYTPVTKARFRFATTDDELPPGRVIDIQRDPESPVVTVIIKPGHATQRLLDELSETQTPMHATGQWQRLEPTPENLAHPRRVLRASWRLWPREKMPAGQLCVPLERHREHVWAVLDREASDQLAREMTELVMAMVQSEVWITRGGGEGGEPS
ncbi:hypothetical protein HYE82_03460 [Streptomyces sp. BR123]|uniref:hypothetical protein n=1 Tax=Streptomyces sp. BR123 TaxID=2749828 RepID=UPI0015C468AB|nr:hypothetical protein [Streptomyces sp. BR123]NXY93479.1 hypothetical protein [Streptomyces sp. BR123]